MDLLCMTASQIYTIRAKVIMKEGRLVQGQPYQKRLVAIAAKLDRAGWNALGREQK